MKARIILLVVFSSLMISCTPSTDKKINKVVELVSFNDVENVDQLTKLINTYKLCDGKYWVVYVGNTSQIMLTQQIKNAVFFVDEKSELFVTLLERDTVFVSSENNNLIKKSNEFINFTHDPFSIEDFPFEHSSSWIIKNGEILKKDVRSCD